MRNFGDGSCDRDGDRGDDVGGNRAIVIIAVTSSVGGVYRIDRNIGPHSHAVSEVSEETSRSETDLFVWPFMDERESSGSSENRTAHE